MTERVEELHDCLLKKLAKEKNLPTIEEFRLELENLLQEVVEFEEKREQWQKAFKNEIPYLLVKQR